MRSDARGYTVLELVIVIAIVGILAVVSSLGSNLPSMDLERTGTQLSLDMESYSALASYGTHAYVISFSRSGYEVKRIGSSGTEVVKSVLNHGNVQFSKVPKSIYMTKIKGLEVSKDDMTIKLVDPKSGGTVCITTVPVSKRVLLTDSPSSRLRR